MKKTSQDEFVEPSNERTSSIKTNEKQQALTGAMSEIFTAINSSLDLDKVLDCILENLSTIIPSKTSNIMLIEGTKARIVRSKGYDLLGTEKLILSREFEFENFPPLIKMIQTKQPLLAYNPKLNKNWNLLPENEWIRSHIGAPIIAGDEVIGFINCDSDIEGCYNRSQMIEIQLFAIQAGLAIQNAKSYHLSTNLGKIFKSINDVVNKVLESDDPRNVKDWLPGSLVELFSAENVYLTKWDQETNTVAGYGTSKDDKVEFRKFSTRSGEETVTEKVLLQQSPLFIADTTQAPEWEFRNSDLIKEKTVLCFPIYTDTFQLGVIFVAYLSPNLNVDELLSLGDYVSTQISTALNKVISLELEKSETNRLSHANQLIETLSKVSGTIKSGADTNTVIETIGSELEKLKIHSLVGLRVGKSESMSLAYTSVQLKLMSVIEKISGLKVDEIRTPFDVIPLFKEIVENQTAHFVDNPDEILKQIVPSIFIPMLWKLMEGLSINKKTKAFIVPLVIDNQTIGMLSMWGENLQQVDIQAAMIFGGQVAIAIENANLLQEVQRLAITDELTDLLNRRGFSEAANHEHSAAVRYNRPLSLIMLDIDRFKTINDMYGHIVGDEILQEIAVRCKSKIRENDYVARYGGEEFIILLVEQVVENAKNVAERIRINIASQPFLTSAGKIPVTVSMGITSMNKNNHDIQTMIRLADKALYNSKESGRNKITVINE